MLPWPGRDPGFPTRSVGKPTVRQDPGYSSKDVKPVEIVLGGYFEGKPTKLHALLEGTKA